MRRASLRAEDLLREMRSGVAPVDPEEAVLNRRARTIEHLRGAQARVRVEREYGQARRRRTRLAAFAVVPALAAAATMYFVRHEVPRAVVATRAEATMHVRAIEGRVDVIHGGRSAETRAGVDSRLDTGDGIRTAGESRAFISMSSGTSVQAGASTNLAVSVPDLTHRETIELALGRVDVSVPKLAPGSNFSVHTPHATVTVHGTRFSVVVVEGAAHDLETKVAVAEGVVAVEHDGRTVALTAGDNWSSGDDRATSTDRTAPAPAHDDHAAVAQAAPKTLAKEARHAAGPRENQANFADERSSTLSEENALMERAMVSSRNGDDRSAVALLDTLLARYPHSILRDNAQVERFRALRRLGDVSGASRGAQHYLAEHPEGLGRDEAKRLAVEPPTH